MYKKTDVKKEDKNHKQLKKVGHTSKFSFGIYWWTWKTTTYLLKKLLKRADKKCKNFNIYNVVFSLKTSSKTPGDIIIFHLCSKNLDDMITALEI